MTVRIQTGPFDAQAEADALREGDLEVGAVVTFVGTVRDVNENLGSQIAAATQMSGHLKNMLAEGDGIIRRLSKIAIAARPSQEAEPAAPKISSAKAVAAAAEAFSERRRASGLAA